MPVPCVNQAHTGEEQRGVDEHDDGHGAPGHGRNQADHDHQRPDEKQAEQQDSFPGIAACRSPMPTPTSRPRHRRGRQQHAQPPRPKGRARRRERHRGPVRRTARSRAAGRVDRPAPETSAARAKRHQPVRPFPRPAAASSAGQRAGRPSAAPARRQTPAVPRTAGWSRVRQSLRSCGAAMVVAIVT